MQDRIFCNSVVISPLRLVSGVSNNQCMPQRRNNRFRDLVSEGARLFPSLWKSSGEMNITAMAKLYRMKGWPVSQPTLQRLWDGEYDPSNTTIDATYHVFGIPRELLRGESRESDMNELLTGYGLPTLLIAKKLAKLPKEDFDAIVTQIELATVRAEKLHRLMEESGGTVTPIDKKRRHP